MTAAYEEEGAISSGVSSGVGGMVGVGRRHLLGSSSLNTTVEASTVDPATLRKEAAGKLITGSDGTDLATALRAGGMASIEDGSGLAAPPSYVPLWT